MKEIQRTDSLNIDRYIDYLQENGIMFSGKKNAMLFSRDKTKKNVAGVNISEIPAISNNNIVFKESNIILEKR
jgi:hypothetical protein